MYDGPIGLAFPRHRRSQPLIRASSRSLNAIASAFASTIPFQCRQYAISLVSTLTGHHRFQRWYV